MRRLVTAVTIVLALILLQRSSVVLSLQLPNWLKESGIMTGPTSATQARTGGRAAAHKPYRLNNQLSPDFAATAFSATSSHPQLTAAQAIRLVSSTYCDLSKATAVSASYKSWTSATLLTHASGKVWLVVAHGMRTYDPGGEAGGCTLRPATPSNCAALRSWDNLMFIVDDAARKVIEATPFSRVEL